MPILDVWSENQGHLHKERLATEASIASRNHLLPASLAEWKERAGKIRSTLEKKLRLGPPGCELDYRVHNETVINGIKILGVSYQSRPGIRVSGNLYVPPGDGPFPGVMNLHGHHRQGKIAERVQARGHLLAMNGFVVLTVDAAGSGERGTTEREWVYHGASAASSLFLTGDSLLALQVRDNMRGVDVLASLPFVDNARLGVTGASGGGNQTMWLGAMDQRLKAVVPVVSAGSFKDYITNTNCVCETLPGGIHICEEWGLFGLVAPRALLLLNAIHDMPAFAPAAVTPTSKALRDLYLLHGARERFDNRLIDATHGYWPPMMEAMLGWMAYWLKGKGPGTPVALPEWQSVPENDLLCYAAGTRPGEYSYALNRQTIAKPVTEKKKEASLQTPESLARLIGWRPLGATPDIEVRQTLPNGIAKAVFISPRHLPVPLLQREGDNGAKSEIHVILSHGGKNAPFAQEQWEKSIESGACTVMPDLPAIGELSWEQPISHGRFHDSARACIWLGYTLAAEWAETIAALCKSLRQEHPGQKLVLIAEEEVALAALLACAIEPECQATVVEKGTPKSLVDFITQPPASLAWFIPGLLEWGDLDDIRRLAQAKA